jgi:hypothetical protein
MRTIQRACVMAGLALSASFGVAAPALAAGGHDPDAYAPDPSSIHAQAQQSGTVQTNINVSPVHQVNIGSDGHQAAMTWAQQGNTNTPDQDETQKQGED